VTLCPEAVDHPEGAPRIDERGGFVFPGTGATGHIVEPKKALSFGSWSGPASPTGATRPDGVTLHDLRRTLGSWQARTGASLAIIGKSLNHKSQQATAIYARLDLDPVRASVNTATAAMLEAGGMKSGAEVVQLPKQGKA
jgi:integrase